MVASTSRGWMQEGVIRGSMLGTTMRQGDEELGKKDDDFHHHHQHHSSRVGPGRHAAGAPWSLTFRWRRRRLLLAITGVLVLYLVFWRTGSDAEVVAQPTSNNPFAYQPPYRGGNSRTGDDEPVGPPPGTPQPKQGAATPHTYDGQVRFFRLASSLRTSASHVDGYQRRNRNVVFAMSSLANVAMLLPMVCDMSKWRRNHVHAVFMGREDIALHDLLDINGIDRADCPAVWHDARPDYTEYSSDSRAEAAVTGAMSHINSFLHPQAVVMGDAPSEDAPFVHGMRSKTKALNLPLVEIPKDKSEHLTWLTRLDCGSLRQWHIPTVDIVIQVPPGSSSVLRLLKSIREADYSGLTRPRIVLELPGDLDDSVVQYVEKFTWPAHDAQPEMDTRPVIRRRVASRGATQEESAIRFLELFYPPDPLNSHVLVLSPQAQLAPQYFQFVRHALLEYKYSKFGAEDNGRLMGVSLQLPSLLLDGNTELAPPTLSDMHTTRYEELYPKTESAPFLWQAPNSHAALFFGDKWVELHSFLSNRVMKHAQSTQPPQRTKLVSETLPSWMEYMLELMRARGYSLLYPARTASVLASIHNELYYAPEEFTPLDLQGEAKSSMDEAHGHDSFLRAKKSSQPRRVPESSVFLGSTPLHLALPFAGDLPEIPHLPQLLHDGTKVNPTMVVNIAAEYANDFRKAVGGCSVPPGKHKKMVRGNARDLFCFGDDDDDWIDDKVSMVSEYAILDEVQDKVTTTSSMPAAVSSDNTQAVKTPRLAHEATGLG